MAIVLLINRKDYEPFMSSSLVYLDRWHFSGFPGDSNAAVVNEGTDAWRLLTSEQQQDDHDEKDRGDRAQD